MSGHFRVDVNPDGLDDAAERLGRVPAELDTAAEQVTAAGSAVGGGAWRGGAATVVIPEINSLARAGRGFAEPVGAGSRAVATFADIAREAVEVRVPDLNRRWEQAQADHAAAVAAADRSHESNVAGIARDTTPGMRRMLVREYDEAARSARSAAGQDLRGTQGALEAEFQQLRDDLTQAAKTAGEALATAVAVPVQPGTTDYDAVTAAAAGLPGLGLVRDREHSRRMTTDATRVADELLEFTGAEPGLVELSDDALGLLAAHAGDLVFAAELLRRLGPEATAALPYALSFDYQVQTELARDTDGHEALVDRLRIRNREAYTALGTVLATASTPDGLDPDWVDEYLESSRSIGYAGVTEPLRLALEVDPDLVVGSSLSVPLFRAVVDHRRDDPHDHGLAREFFYPLGTDPLGFSDRDQDVRAEDQVVLALRALGTDPSTALDVFSGPEDEHGLPTVDADVAWLFTEDADLLDDGRALGNTLAVALVDARADDPREAALAARAYVGFLADHAEELPDDSRAGIGTVLGEYVIGVDAAVRYGSDGEAASPDEALLDLTGNDVGFAAGGLPVPVFARGDVENLLGRLSGDQEGRAAVLVGASALTEARLAFGAQQDLADREAGRAGWERFGGLTVQAGQASSFEGFLVEQLGYAGIEDAAERDARRAEYVDLIAGEAFGLIPTPAGRVAGVAVGLGTSVIQDRVTEALQTDYEGQARSDARDLQDDRRDLLRGQVGDTALAVGLLEPDATLAGWEEPLQGWPTDPDGVPIPYRNLPEDQRTRWEQQWYQQSTAMRPVETTLLTEWESEWTAFREEP